MGRVSGQIMGNWDKKGAKLLEQQVPELNKVLYKGTLDGTPKGLVATLKEKPDADKKDGLKYEKENMKYTYEEIKKMATDD